MREEFGDDMHQTEKRPEIDPATSVTRTRASVCRHLIYQLSQTGTKFIIIFHKTLQFVKMWPSGGKNPIFVAL